MIKTISVFDIEKESQDVFIEYILENKIENDKIIDKIFQPPPMNLSVIEISPTASFGLNEEYYGLYIFEYVCDCYLFEIEYEGYRVEKVTTEKIIKEINYVRI